MTLPEVSARVGMPIEEVSRSLASFVRIVTTGPEAGVFVRADAKIPSSPNESNAAGSSSLTRACREIGRGNSSFDQFINGDRAALLVRLVSTPRAEQQATASS